MRILSCRALLIALFVFRVAGQAQTTIRVPADQPTIQAGIDAAQNGDTVLVSPGTYTESLDFKGKAITVTTGAASWQEAAGTYLQHTSATGPIVNFHSGETRAAVLNGFTMQNGIGTAVATTSSPTISNNAFLNNAGCDVVIVAPTASPMIQGNHFAGTRLQSPGATSRAQCGTYGSGVYATLGISGRSIQSYFAGDVEIIDNLIEGVAPDGCGSALYAEYGGQKLSVRNNVIRNSLQPCGWIYFFFETNVETVELIQNLIYGNRFNTQGGPLHSGSDPAVFLESSYPLPGGTTTSQLTLINNTITDNVDLESSDGNGGQLSFGNEDNSQTYTAVVENNIFSQTLPGTPVYCAVPSPTTLITFSHNDIPGLGTSFGLNCLSGIAAQGNLMVDPEFVDPANGDFHTSRTSPVVAAGDIQAPLIPASDLDDRAREVCGTIDMGVYEVHPQPPVAVSSSNNPSVGGSAVTFTAHVTGNCNLPTGKVTFYDGTNSLGTSVLDAGANASVTTSSLTVGDHNITASYAGDYNFDASVSPVLVQTVTGYPTQTTLMVSPTTAQAFTPITLSSQVSSAFGMPTGSVTFHYGSTVLATVALDGTGHAATTVSTLGAGTYAIVATYSADVHFAASSSAAVMLTVNGADTVTSLSVTPNPAFVTAPVTLTASVSEAQGSVVPGGSVVFDDGGVPLGAAVGLDSKGVAQMVISTLGIGTHTIRALYGGAGNFNGSAGTATETVVMISTGVTLTAAPNPANQGQAVTMVARVAPGLNGAEPVGSVVFGDGSTVLQSVGLAADGSASFTTTTLALGTHPLQATYSGSTNFAGGVSSVVNEVVQPFDFTVTASRSSVSLPRGDWTVVDITVTPVGGFHGNVSLSCVGLPAHAQCVFDPSATAALGSAQVVHLTLNTSDVYHYLRQAELHRSRQAQTLEAACEGAVMLLLMVLRRRRAFGKTLLLTIGLLGVLAATQGCSGHVPAQVVPGSYGVTVLGASGALSHTVPLLMTVTQ